MSNARNLARLLPNSSGQLPDAAMASGSVLQVVQNFGTTSSTTSTSNVSVISQAITPTNASSKILVFVSGLAAQNATNAWWNLSIYRDAVEAQTGYGNYGWYGSSMQKNDQVFLSLLDSPATTESVTYSMRVRTAYGQTLTLYRPIITLMEIAG